MVHSCRGEAPTKNSNLFFQSLWNGWGRRIIFTKVAHAGCEQESDKWKKSINKMLMRTNWFHLILAWLLLNLGCALAAPLDNWYWRNPLPNGNPQLTPQMLNGIVFAGGKFVAVGASGVVSISIDSTNWIESATATTNDLNGIVYANGELVAVGNGGTVETSADGSNWVLQNSGTTNPLSAVAFGNGKFVAVGGYANGEFVAADGKAVIASPNGVNWMPVVSGLSGASTIAGGSNGFVALVPWLYQGPSPAQAFYSSDGLTWTSQTLTAPGNSFSGEPLVNNIVTYWNGIFLIGSYRYTSSQSADAFIFSSTNGTNWSTNVLGNQFTGSYGFDYDFFMIGSNDVIAAGAALDDPFLQFSTDGINWSQTAGVPYANIQYNLGAVAGAYGNGNYVILAPTSSFYSLPPIFTSSDGLTWVNRQHAPGPPAGSAYTFTCIASNNGVYVVASVNSIAVSSNGLSYVIASNTPALGSVLAFGNAFVGVGSGGGIYVSTNGLSWTQRNSGTTSSLHGVAAGNGLLVSVGDGGAIQTSPSGQIWTSRTSGTSLALYSVTCSNGIFVAVGQEGTVLTSADGVNWSAQYSGTLSNLLSVAYGSVGFLAVGPGGTIITSADGTNWLLQNPGTLGNLENVSYGNGYYLVTGNGGVALTSPDGITWTFRNLGLTGGQNLYGSSFINSRFEVVGGNGTILESDVIAPLFDIHFFRAAAPIKLTLFATPGSNFRLQSSTNISSGWNDLALFSNASGITHWTNSFNGAGLQFYRLVSP